MSNVLRKARTLSSENDASVKQSQETNVEIKIKPQRSQPVSQPIFYPNVPQVTPQLNPQVQPQNVNFTIPEENSQYQFQPPTNNLKIHVQYHC